MDIIIAKNCGLCYGVKRALELAKNTRHRQRGKVFTLGELIHNPQVIARLEKQGIHSVKSPGSIKTGLVIIRSHGVAPRVYEQLERKKIKVVDATCPIVKKIQRLVECLTDENKEVIIVGNRQHPETRGLIGYSTRGKGRIIENEAQVQSLPRRKKRAVLAQSTQDSFLFGRIVAALVEKTDCLEVHNTICHSTQTRQKSTSELAGQVDTLFIVGGKKSSNTNKLYEISRRIQPNTYFIENASDITSPMLKGARKIGLSGGASTPPEVIEEAVARIRKIFNRQSQRESIVQWQS